MRGLLCCPDSSGPAPAAQPTSSVPFPRSDPENKQALTEEASVGLERGGSPAEGGGDLPKVTTLGRGQLSWSWSPNPGAKLDRGRGGEGAEPAGWPGEAEGASLRSLLRPLLTVWSEKRDHVGKTNFLEHQLGDSRHPSACSAIHTTLCGGCYAHFVDVGTEAQRDSGRLLEGTCSWLVTEQRFKPNTSPMVHAFAHTPDGKEGGGTVESGLLNPQ